jgi:hypothetical protein
MKRLKLPVMIAAILGMAFFTETVKAQSPVNFGIRGGLNISNLHGSDFDYDPRVGVHVGAVLDLSLPMLPIGIESGVFYAQKGAEADDEGITGKVKLDYIEVPVLAKIQLGPPGPISPHLLLGPYMAFNINAESEFTDGSTTVGGNLDDETRDLEFGAIAAVGLDFSLGVTKLNAQARYSYGFTSTFEDDFDDGERNAVFTLAVGIMF